jgi:hypothetical protein
MFRRTLMAQPREQICRMDRLRQDLELASLRMRLFQQVHCRCLPRKQQHLAARKLLAHLDRRLDSRNPRHHHVREKQVRLETLRQLHQHLATVHSACVETGAPQDNRQGVRDDLFVIGDKHLRFDPLHPSPNSRYVSLQIEQLV